MGDGEGKSTKLEEMSISDILIFRCTTEHSTQGNPIPTGQAVGVATKRKPPTPPHPLLLRGIETRSPSLTEQLRLKIFSVK
jgi:hypothetical protein